jgi:hypothetical protein
MQSDQSVTSNNLRFPGPFGEAGRQTRREFLRTAFGAAIAGTGGSLLDGCASRSPTAPSARGEVPWHRHVLRWGQTNITEIDPARYDIAWWREYWKRTRTQGVIINAGGIVAYYPSKFPLHHQAEFLNGRDLYGELAAVAHADGLAVLARMDSSRAHQDFHRAHTDWFAVDDSGQAYRAGELYVTCINSPYYEEYLPQVLREIIERTRPEGIADNSWSGLERSRICHCENCARRFHEATSNDLPREKNWNSPVYRQWIRWNYSRRLEVWDMNNSITKAAGGPDCLWIGMNSGSVSGQSQNFRDFREICRRAQIILLDHQARGNAEGFQANGEAGKLVHGLLGWDKLVPESMAMYQAGTPTFRLSSKPEPEARMWMLDGIAGGLQPWWHHVGAYAEDRRMYHTAEPLLAWHQTHENLLVNREPIATIGVVWSQQNTDFYGRDNAAELVDLPYRGAINALVRARIPFLPVHIDQVEAQGAKFSLLILPALAVMSDAQCAVIRRFVERSGGLIATGDTSRHNEWGDPREDYGLADLFGAHLMKGRQDSSRQGEAAQTLHSYLRLTPERRGAVDGPKTGDEPPVTGQRHPALRGFEETDILPFGGRLEPLRVDEGAEVLMTFVPSFPIYPPETAWMRVPKTNIPGLIVNESHAGRVVFLPADLDRRFGRDNLPDHGNLLANLVRWAARDDIPLAVEGHGLLDCHLYRQSSQLILHLVNLTSAGSWRAPVDELIPIGPLRVKVKLPPGVTPGKPRLMVSGETIGLTVANRWAVFDIRSILDHEMAVI